jgi:hypothetical protein
VLTNSFRSYVFKFSQKYVASRLSLRALREKQHLVHAETAKWKTRKDRRESRFPMSLRALRVDRMKSRIQNIKSAMQLAMAMPSLRALRETVLILGSR